MIQLGSRPAHTEPAHWQEWLDSGVDPAIISLNVRSISDLEADPYTQEASYPIAELLNWRVVRFGHQARPNLHGWCVSGVDPLNGFGAMNWIRFKPDPDTPVIDSKKDEPAKYLSPKDTASRLVLLRVSWEVGFKVAENCGLRDIYEQRFLQSCCSLQQEDPLFWKWVRDTAQVPITHIEGEKKAGALLTQGYAAIALPGINGAVRVKDRLGNPLIAPKLIPDLEPFITEGRDISVCFDFETKPKTIQAIERETEKLSRCLGSKRCRLKVVSLPGPEKGADDFIVSHGAEAYHACYQKRLTFDLWQTQRYSRLTYKPSLTLNQRYLGELPIPETARLVGIKSPKGTGKTESFGPIVEEANRNRQRVLLISHRVQLAQAICDRVGLPYITELRTAQEGQLLGYGLCIDSLHPESQARFNADYWHDCIVIIDECEQVFWHLLDATTEVSNRRTPILNELKKLLINTLESETGRVILSDADLSNLSLEFVWGLIEQKLDPYLVVNDYLPEEPWLVHHYPQKKPDQWLAALDEEVRTGGRPFIFTQSQRSKSRWSTTTLECWLSKRYPEKKFLRIDSETIANPAHPAYLCTSKLNSILVHYDGVIASPSIETGVSIDIQEHFSSVWGCLIGVTSENSARQSLARVREAVPRHIWIASHGLGKVANGSTSVKAILSAEYQLARITAKLVQVISFDDELISSYSIALRAWAKMAARINAGMIHYRETVLDGLRREGHLVEEATYHNPSSEPLDELEEAKTEQHQSECEAIANADLITQKQYDELKSKKAKTPEERHKERKFLLHTRYQVEVTPELVRKDDDGWYAKLRLFYFQGKGRVFLQDRDSFTLENILKTSGGWLPTINRSQIGIRVWVLEQLGVTALLDLDEEFNGGTKAEAYEDAHPVLKRVAEMARRFSFGVRNSLGITVNEKMSPIQIAQSLLSKLGVKLQFVRQEGGKGTRQRLYRYLIPEDGRSEVTDQWFSRDQIKRNESEMHTPGLNKKDTQEVA